MSTPMPVVPFEDEPSPDWLSPARSQNLLAFCLPSHRPSPQATPREASRAKTVWDVWTRAVAPRHYDATLAVALQALREQLAPSETQRELEALKARVDELERAQRSAVLVVKQVERNQAKAEILQYITENPGTYPSDAGLALGIDLAMARDLAIELVDEGHLVG